MDTKMKKRKLFCLPHAGASATLYLQCEKYLDGGEIIPLDPPGRGRRMSEPLCETIEEVVADLKAQVVSHLSPDDDFTFYGHSMGALLIYELLHEMMRDGMRLPSHIFISGRNSPSVPQRTRLHKLSGQMFIDRIMNIGGTSKEFFENPVLVKLYVPIMKTDLKIVETYRHPKREALLPVNISCFYAPDDPCISLKSVEKWARLTSGTFRMHYFEGNHFFIFYEFENMVRIMEETLAAVDEPIPY